MSFLGLGGRPLEDLRGYPAGVETASISRDETRPANATIERVSFVETVRRACSNPECAGSWTMPWRNKRRPVFEGEWGCSGRCMLGLVRAALKREAGDPRAALKATPYRHRVPLGLVMLAQGWITNPQLQAALEAQRAHGSGRIGDWLVAECGLSSDHVTRGLSSQWGCPVISPQGFVANEMSLVMPHQFVAEFGLVPIRVAGGRILYLGGEDRLNASVAYAVEQMSGLKVESGLVDSVELKVARRKLLCAPSIDTVMKPAADEDVIAGLIADALDQKQPIAARLVRLHQYYWLRLWLESGTKGRAGNIPRGTEDMQDRIFSVSGRA